MRPARKLNENNYLNTYLQFEDRQAGVSVVYNPDKGQYYYNAYCIDQKLIKEIFTVEHDYLIDALELINDEFGTWEKKEFEEEKDGCGSCAAK